MNRSPTQKTANRRANSQIKYSPVNSNSSNPNNLSVSTLYFCHYKNAMYMGGIKSFKKDGKGILIHDCGLSVATSYLNDLMHGHNIFFAQHCLLSTEFVKGKLIEAVYRTDGFLGHFHFNGDGQLDGKCKLFNYTNKTITYASFRKGVMFEKVEESDFTLLNRVFDLGEFDFLIGRTHFRVMKYDFEKVNNIEGQKYGNKLTIGFEKGGLINGLGFTIVFRGSHGGYNPDTHRNQDEFELKVIERGYMTNSQLNGFGEKWFKNGNLYIGEFKNSIFEGNGILRNTAKKNWVSGYFEKGNLVDLLEYNSQGQEKRYDKIVQALHERKTNWINNEIMLLPIELFDSYIEKIITCNPTAAVRTLEQRKQEVLKKIQDNFICQPNSLPSFLETVKQDLKLLEKEKNTGEKESIKKFVHSFIPEEAKKINKQDQNAAVESGYKLSSSRRVLGTSIRKSKIFDRTSSSDNYLKIENAKSPKKSPRNTEAKKKIFGQTSTGSKYPLKAVRDDINNSHEAEGSPQVNSSLHYDEAGNSKQWNGLESSIGAAPSQKSYSGYSQGDKRNTSKSKIFKYLQNQAEETAPKFTYTKVETLGQSQKRKRLGLEDSN